MRVSSIAILLLLQSPPTLAWISSTAWSRSLSRTHSATFLGSASDPSTSSTTTASLGLTPELEKLTTAFQQISDDKLRYKQLLYMAQQLPPMPDDLKTPDHLVPGCLSTVHVHATFQPDTGTVAYTGDSDGLLTKGLVALLVRGLSNCTPEQIQKVQPEFIQTTGIGASLTPGRNNGFLNMLRVMKQQAMDLLEKDGGADGEPAGASRGSETAAPIRKYDRIVAALQRELQPVQLDLVDNSHQHAGHAGNDMDGESHFDLSIVSDAFEGLNLVKRHKLVYSVLGDIMPQIHALQIRAQTPCEAGLE